MNAMTVGVGAMEPEDVEGLLPWHATGTLNSRDARRVEDALQRDPRLARQYALIQEEIAETIHVNESLGAPSSRAMQKLFTAIDAEPPRRAARRQSNAIARIADFLVSLSPRTLAYSAAIGAVALLLQAGVIGTVMMTKPGGYQTAAFDGPSVGARALVRFEPDARLSDITQFLDAHNASIISGPKAGMFRIQLGERPMSKQEVDTLLSQLRSEKIVNFAEQAQ